MNNKNDKKVHPSYIMDLMNGYCKQNSNASIPLCLMKLFAVYFFMVKIIILFRIRFKSPAKFAVGVSNTGELLSRKYFQAISSLASYFIISNKCTKLILKIGDSFEIEMNIGESEIEIKAKDQIMLLRNFNDEVWKINRKSKKFIDIMFRMNRKTPCGCANSDGNVELFFTTIEEIPEMNSSDSLSQLLKSDNAKDQEHCYITHPRKYGGIIKKDTDGHYQISLSDTFDFNSNEKVSIEAHGIEEINVWSSKYAHHQWDKFGYGRNCCVRATFQYSGYGRR